MTAPRKVRPQRLPQVRAIATYPDESFYVTRQEGSNWLMQTMKGDMNSQRYYWLHSYDNTLLEVGAGAFDYNGNLYVATSAGLQILDQNGRVRGILKMPCEANLVSEVVIRSGSISLNTPSGKAYTRKLNIEPAELGVRPKSQGQG